MKIQVKDLYYNDSFVFIHKNRKEVRCTLKHKRPHNSFVELITNVGTFWRSPEQIVELIPKNKPYSKGGWICKCLNIYPCSTRLCTNCGYKTNPWQFNTLIKVPKTRTWTCFCGKKALANTSCKCGFSRIDSIKKTKAHRYKMWKLNLDRLKPNTDN